MLLLAAQHLAMIAANRANKVRREIANADLNRARKKKKCTQNITTEIK